MSKMRMRGDCVIVEDGLDESHVIEVEVHNWKEAKQFLPTPAKIIGWVGDGNSLLIEDEKTGKVYFFHSVIEEDKEVYENVKLVTTDALRLKSGMERDDKYFTMIDNAWREYLKGAMKQYDA